VVTLANSSVSILFAFAIIPSSGIDLKTKNQGDFLKYRKNLGEKNLIAHNGRSRIQLPPSHSSECPKKKNPPVVERYFTNFLEEYISEISIQNIVIVRQQADWGIRR